MNLSKTNITLIFLALITSASLQSCDHRKIIAEASNAINHRNYNKALSSILSISDNSIIESDTLSKLLSTAYYGLQLKPTKPIAVECYDMDFSPDGKTVIFTDFRNKSLNFYSYPEMEFSHSITLPHYVYNIDISPDNSTIAAAMENNTILLYDMESTQEIKVLEGGHSSRVRDVVFRDKDYLFSCSNDQSITAWNIAEGKPYWKRRQHSRNIKSLQLSKDKTKLITASNDGSACVITAVGDKAGAEEARFIHSENYVNDAAISPDNKLVVTVSGDGYAKIWNAEIGHSYHEIFLNDPLLAVDVSDDGKFILIGGTHNVYIIESATGLVTTKIHGTNMPIWAAQFIDNKRFAFSDNSQFWHGEILTREQLVNEARKLPTK